MRWAAVILLTLVVGCTRPPDEGGPGTDVPQLEAPPVDEPRTSWPMGPRDLRGSRAALDETQLTARSVSDLGLLWSVVTNGSLTGTPTVREGAVYVASWKGHVYAFDTATGATRWTRGLGAQIDAPVTLWEDLALVGDAKGRLHALRAATGEPVWSVLLDATNSTHLYGTAIVHEGVAYIGVASDQESIRLHGERPLDFRGSVVALDARTGAERWRTVLVPEGHTGAPVWGTPVIAEELGVLIVGTGNAYTEPAAELTDAIVALDLDGGAIRWAFQAYGNDVFTQASPKSPDWDFGSTPSLFHDASGRLLAGLGQKSSRYWAMDAANGTVAWRYGDPRPGQGIIAASAYADGLAIVAQTELKRVDALDVTRGEPVWSHVTRAMVYSAPAIVPGAVLAADTGGELAALELRTGRVLWNGTTGAAGGVFGGLSVAEGKLFVPTVEAGFLGERGHLLVFAPGADARLPGDGGEGEGAPDRVELLNVAFRPDHLVVGAGTRVTWVNGDAIYHTATSGWDRGASFDLALQPGKEGSHVFDQPGTFQVYCKPHASPDGAGGWSGMVMTVVVEEAAPT